MQSVRCDNLFDGRRFVGPATIEIEGDRIAAVRVGEEESADSEALHVRSVLPGLIDAHMHVVGYPEGPPGADPFALHRNALRLLALNGVTTVRDAGNAIETTRYAALWSDANAGPQIVPTGPFLDAPPVRWLTTRIVQTPEDAEAEVARLAAEGLRWVSVYRNVPLDAIQALTTRAQAAGLDVLADVSSTGAGALAEAGVRSVEHAPFLLDLRGPDGAIPASVAALVRLWAAVDPKSEAVDRVIEQLERAGTFVCPTLFATERWCSIQDMVQEPHLDAMTAVVPSARHFLQMRQPMGMMVGRRFLQSQLGIPSLSKGEKAEAQRGLDVLAAVVGRLHEAGVPLVAGTDAPMPSVVPGYSLHEEVARLHRAGLSPADALAAATSTAARLLRLDGEVGVVEAGARADLVLLDGDPGQDIADLRCVSAVLRAGQAVPRSAFTEVLREAVVTS